MGWFEDNLADGPASRITARLGVDTFNSVNAYLHLFDARVRNEFAPAVTEFAGGGRISYKYALVASVASLWYCFDAGIDNLDTLAALRYTLEFLTLFLGIIPLFVKFALNMVILFDKYVCNHGNRCIDCLITLAYSLVALVWMFVFYFTNYISRTVASVIPQAV